MKIIKIIQFYKTISQKELKVEIKDPNLPCIVAILVSLMVKRLTKGEAQMSKTLQFMIIQLLNKAQRLKRIHKVLLKCLSMR